MMRRMSNGVTSLTDAITGNNTDRAVSVQDKISQQVEQMKKFPKAVDQMLVILTAIRGNPDRKYYTLDMTSEGYQEWIQDVPGTYELLLTVRYKKHGNILRLDKRRIDLALIWMAINSLEMATSSTKYLNARNTHEVGDDVKAADFTLMA